LKLLLDTDAALWWLADDDRLSATAASHIASGSNNVMLSAVVVWEVAIKRSLGKLDAPPGFAATLVSAGAEPLAITIAHAEAAEALEWHHRDPFDRLLIAQARAEGAVLVSGDAALTAYRVPTIW
jgi:PIN domain nuclease of toxin-antitoxin system